MSRGGARPGSGRKPKKLKKLHVQSRYQLQMDVPAWLYHAFRNEARRCCISFRELLVRMMERCNIEMNPPEDIPIGRPREEPEPEGNVNPLGENTDISWLTEGDDG